MESAAEAISEYKKEEGGQPMWSRDEVDEIVSAQVKFKNKRLNQSKVMMQGFKISRPSFCWRDSTRQPPHWPTQFSCWPFILKFKKGSTTVLWRNWRNLYALYNNFSLHNNFLILFYRKKSITIWFSISHSWITSFTKFYVWLLRFQGISYSDKVNNFYCYGFQMITELNVNVPKTFPTGRSVSRRASSSPFQLLLFITMRSTIPIPSPSILIGNLHFIIYLNAIIAIRKNIIKVGGG